jgi:hypothetical protein
MPALLIGFAALLVVVALARLLAAAEPRSLARVMRVLGAVIAVVAGALLTLRGLGVIGAPLAVAGLGFLLPRRRPRIEEGLGGGAPPPPPGPDLSLDEAYAILGLEAGATAEEVKAAHRRLIARVHPDHGGSDWMAAKLNRAKELILESLG